MKYYFDLLRQQNKNGQIVCGDCYLARRTPEYAVFVLCDGIGSGVYANIAAITCANRLQTLIGGDLSLKACCEMVAESMHRARTENIPFAAFSALRVLYGGQFNLYSYEAPQPLLIRDGKAAVLEQQFSTVKYEMIAESSGVLSEGDTLLLLSDGATQAGLGMGYPMGWGSDGIRDASNRLLERETPLPLLADALMEQALSISGGVYHDDTSIAMVTCGRASELCILTGPPTRREQDADIVETLMNTGGAKVVCGSSTSDLVARELKREVRLEHISTGFSDPPEYAIDGIDLITEGAITLNQAMNLLEEDVDENLGASAVFRLIGFLKHADVITFLIGGAVNNAHADPLFIQVGIQPRAAVVRRMIDYLRQHGKLVIVKRF